MLQNDITMKLSDNQAVNSCHTESRGIGCLNFLNFFETSLISPLDDVGAARKVFPDSFF